MRDISYFLNKFNMLYMRNTW